MTADIVQVAVPCPLYRLFDYRLPDPAVAVRPGCRVRVPFGRRRLIGIVTDRIGDSDLEPARIRPVDAVLDHEPVLPADVLDLIRWSARYYHHPPGEAFATALPALLRQGQAAARQAISVWQVTPAGLTVAIDTALARAPRQAALLGYLQDRSEGAGRDQLQADGLYHTAALRALGDKGWIRRLDRSGFDAAPAGTEPQPGPALNPDQALAVDAINHSRGFTPQLLEGVTGSGKTEVYLHAIEHCLAAGRQALLLVPEIGLTPQLMRRLRARLPVPVVGLHSGLTDRERLNAWLAARDGQAGVVVGTRSAVFTPLPAAGLFIVDEEHDPSLKQQDGFRYSARDLLIWRARQQGLPIVLGSATPSLESLHNVDQGRYQRLHLPERAGSASQPRLRLLDIRSSPLQEGLSVPLINAMRQHLERDGQILLFLNRRGFAPALICHDCGWVAHCQRCDTHMTLHQGRQQLQCHHCDASQAMPTRCPDCAGTELRALGYGTERIEQTLATLFPGVASVRIDRDTTRRKGQLQQLLQQARSGQARILLGTQMLAKGHHFPDVTLVAVLDADQRLFSSDFRASERLAQMIIQVAGRAGRAERPGTVLIQTRHPDHPLLRLLVEHGYGAFAGAALDERRDAGLPPHTSVALLRAEAVDPDPPRAFLMTARDRLQAAGIADVEFWGPVAAPMEKRAGRFRSQLLIQSASRAGLQRLLDSGVPALAELPEARRIRWSLDVDPADTY